MKTSIFSKSNLGLFFVGLFISGFILLKSTDSFGENNPKPEPFIPCEYDMHHVCKVIKIAPDKYRSVMGWASYSRDRQTLK